MNPWLIAGIAALVLGAFASSSSTATAGAAPGSGAARAPSQTWPSWDAYARYWYSVFRGAGASPVQALGLTALTRIESGAWLGVWAHNPGNVHATGTQGRVVLPTGEAVRAYQTDAEGAQSVFSLLTTAARYAPAAQKLAAGDPDWYRLAIAGGYSSHPASAQDTSTMRDWMQRVRAVVG